ncbi:MAG: hypothetical protein ACLT3W_07415 [Bifidobacterium pseudocatenulatum]
MLISFLVFCLYSLSRGIVAVNREIHHADVYAISRKEVPSPTKEKKSGVPDCDASNVALSLTPAASSFGLVWRFDGFHYGRPSLDGFQARLVAWLMCRSIQRGRLTIKSRAR